MIDIATRVWQVRELFELIKKSGFDGFTPGAVTVKFPDYLPPLIVAEGTEEWISRAGAAIRKCLDYGDAILISAFYEDHRDQADCCVVLSLQLQRPGLKGGCFVENSWLDEIGTITQELLARSVALTMSGAHSGFSFDFRAPVYRFGAKEVQHRDTILLVEDEEFVRRAAREVLESEGHRVLDAGSAEEALLLFGANRCSIGLVVSDVTMPGRNGRDLANALHASIPLVPVLLMSGYAKPVVEDGAKGIYFLAKPFNSEALIKAVERCLCSSHQSSARLGEDIDRQRRLLGSAEQVVPLTYA